MGLSRGRAVCQENILNFFRVRTSFRSRQKKKAAPVIELMVLVQPFLYLDLRLFGDAVTKLLTKLFYLAEFVLYALKHGGLSLDSLIN